MVNKWYYQFLKDEKLHYLTEVHPEEGILGEHFFSEDEFWKLKDFISKNKIPVSLDESVIFETIESSECFLGELKIADIEFDCRIKMYDDKYKSQLKLSLEFIEQNEPKKIGFVIKEMLKQLKEHIKNDKSIR